jgi:predicted MFS family arabinose efflux permease
LQQQQLLSVVVFASVGLNLFLLSHITYEQKKSSSKAKLPTAALCVIAGYAMAAACFVPGSVYLSDYAANELMWGSQVGSSLWLFFGIGGLLSTPLISKIYPRYLNGSALTVLFSTKIIALTIFSFFPDKLAFHIAALLSGFGLPNIVLLTSNWLRENLSTDQFSSAWQVATMCFSSGQAVSALILAVIFDWIEMYQVLFVVALAFVLMGLILVNSRFLFPIEKNEKELTVT